MTPEAADEFTRELNTLMKKYGFAFPSATWIYKAYEGQPDLVANTELLRGFPEDTKFNNHFTLHYDRDETDATRCTTTVD